MALEIQMDEIDFLLLHKLVVHMVKSKVPLTKAVGLLKLNTITNKRLKNNINNEENVKREQHLDEQPEQPVPNGAQPSTSKEKTKKKKPQNEKKTDKKSEGNNDKGSDDVVYVRRTFEKGTQTGEQEQQDIQLNVLPDLVKEEAGRTEEQEMEPEQNVAPEQYDVQPDILPDNIEELKRTFLVDGIRPEKFDEEYENSPDQDSHNTDLQNANNCTSNIGQNVKHKDNTAESSQGRSKNQCSSKRKRNGLNNGSSKRLKQSHNPKKLSSSPSAEYLPSEYET